MTVIMGADAPATGRENKPTIKVENKQGVKHRHHDNRNARRRDEYIKKEKFSGANPNL